MQVGHVEGSEDAVEIAGRNEEQRRRDEVEDRIFDRAVDPPFVGSDHQKPEGRDHEHFEPDVEIEDVAGQERPADAGHHQHQERVEAVAARAHIDVAERIERRNAADDARHEAEQGTERIDGEGDAEWRQPAPHRHDLRAVGKNIAEQQARADGGGGKPAMAIAACRRMRWRIIKSSAPVRIGITHRRDHQPVGGAHRRRGKGRGEIGRALIGRRHRRLVSHRRQAVGLWLGEPHPVGVVGAEILVGAVGEHQQKGEERKRDDDRRQDQRLRQRIGGRAGGNGKPFAR